MQFISQHPPNLISSRPTHDVINHLMYAAFLSSSACRSWRLVSSHLRPVPVAGGRPGRADQDHRRRHSGSLRQLWLADVLPAHVQRHGTQLEAVQTGGQYRGESARVHRESCGPVLTRHTSDFVLCDSCGAMECRAKLCGRPAQINSRHHDFISLIYNAWSRAEALLTLQTCAAHQEQRGSRVERLCFLSFILSLLPLLLSPVSLSDFVLKESVSDTRLHILSFLQHSFLIRNYL